MWEGLGTDKLQYCHAWIQAGRRDHWGAGEWWTTGQQVGVVNWASENLCSYDKSSSDCQAHRHCMDWKRLKKDENYWNDCMCCHCTNEYFRDFLLIITCRRQRYRLSLILVSIKTFHAHGKILMNTKRYSGIPTSATRAQSSLQHILQQKPVMFVLHLENTICVCVYGFKLYT